MPYGILDKEQELSSATGREERRYEKGACVSEEQFAIDYIDRYSETKSAEDRWKVTQSMLAELGASAVNLAVANCDTRGIYWFQSSMREDWLHHYIDNAYFEWDPFIDNLKSGNLIYEAKCGLENRKSTTDSQILGLNWELQDAGYGYLRGIGFNGEFSGTRKLLTFCSDESLTSLSGKEFEDKLRVASVLVAAFQDSLETNHEDSFVFGRTPGTLSDREKEILRLLARGHLNTQIAFALGIAEVTVRKHLQSARLKLDARTREEALAIALISGELDL
ncbi:helix-turn-helix transcriptional regulator [Shimia sediminis]|uniref:helix-turn-helix transcriptional regulator n=1 Tax=Shimia sediminis TaxID=2497945 RepID=UPI000F8E0A56|nr:LuxR family transcriptional regulator [Shimia sediminis]